MHTFYFFFLAFCVTSNEFVHHEFALRALSINVWLRFFFSSSSFIWFFGNFAKANMMKHANQKKSNFFDCRFRCKQHIKYGIHANDASWKISATAAQNTVMVKTENKNKNMNERESSLTRENILRLYQNNVMIASNSCNQSCRQYLSINLLNE